MDDAPELLLDALMFDLSDAAALGFFQASYEPFKVKWFHVKGL
jgi:hypothetical protein